MTEPISVTSKPKRKKKTPEQEAYRVQRLREAFKRIGPRPKEWRDRQSAAAKVALNKPEVRAKLSAGLKASHAAGIYNTPAALKHREEGLAKAQARSRELKTYERSQPRAVAKLRGSHQFGRSQRGRLDHSACKEWCVLSPTGVQYRFSNLLEWCRQNESLFTEPTSKTQKSPLWKRAASGITNQNSRRGKLQSWNGWVLLNVWEKRDPLARNVIGESSNAEQALQPAVTDKLVVGLNDTITSTSGEASNGVVAK